MGNNRAKKLSTRVQVESDLRGALGEIAKRILLQELTTYLSQPDVLMRLSQQFAEQSYGVKP